MTTRISYKCNGTFSMVPDRSAISAAAYYGYDTINSSSAASGYQRVGAITVYLYENITNGNLSLHAVLGSYGNTTGGSATVSITGLPVGFTIAASDDAGETVATSTTTVVGTYSYGAPNTDGFAIDNINNFSSITLTVSSPTNLTEWNIGSYTGQTTQIAFSTTTTITITRIAETFDVSSLVTATPPAGLYLTAPTVILTPADPSYEIKQDLTQKPANAKIIAFDTLSPPNPFIAVIDDGLGRVVLDGGFPKFYNSSWNSATTYTQLSAAHKYMHNAINWVVNPTKVRNGNNNILVFNDGPSSYDSSTFNITLDGIAAVAGYTLTHRNRNNYGGGEPVSIAYNDLDQYAALIIFSTESVTTSVPGLTDTTANLIRQYRESGNGIIVVTDHDVFQSTANIVVNKFGASFFGNVDRSPVSVDFLKTNYGLHPLWNNIPGNVAAGGSEGNVSVTNFPYYTGGNITIPGDGIHTIYTLIEDSDGNFYSTTYSYIVNRSDPITVINLDPVTQFILTVKPQWTLEFTADRIESMDVDGVMRKAGIVVGEFSKTLAAESYDWFDTDTYPVEKTATVFELVTVSPITYVKTAILKRYTRTIDNPLKISSVINSSRGAELADVWGGTANNLKQIRNLTNITPAIKTSSTINFVSSYFSEI